MELPPRTQSYIAALVRDGAAFDYEKWRAASTATNQKVAPDPATPVTYSRIGSRPSDLLNRLERPSLPHVSPAGGRAHSLSVGGNMRFRRDHSSVKISSACRTFGATSKAIANATPFTAIYRKSFVLCGAIAKREDSSALFEVLGRWQALLLDDRERRTPSSFERPPVEPSIGKQSAGMRGF